MTKSISFVVNSSAPQLAMERLRKIEDNFDISFPSDYVDFLVAANGGVPIEKFFSVENNEKIVERFLSIIEGYRDSPIGMYDISVVWSQIEDRLDDSLVPFASLFAGDFLCFKFRGDSIPEVVLWDHERSREDTPSLTFVASSFGTFVEMLHR